MAPPKKGRAVPAKRGRQVDNAEKTDRPPAKKRSTGKTEQPQPPNREVIDIDDEESVRRFIKSLSKPKAVVSIKQMLRPTGAFPRFKDGDVVIELRHASSKFSYQLHGDILQRASPWFAKMLQLDMEKVEPEPDPLLIARTPFGAMLRARFEMKYCPKLENYILARSVSDSEHPEGASLQDTAFY